MLASLAVSDDSFVSLPQTPAERSHLLGAQRKIPEEDSRANVLLRVSVHPTARHSKRLELDQPLVDRNSRPAREGECWGVDPANGFNNLLLRF